MLKDARFILVRAECPYVQSTTAARVINTERFVVGGPNGRERDRSQVSDGKVERTPRARLLLDCVLCVKTIGPFSGVPRPPFYRPRGEQGLQMAAIGKNKGRESPSRVLGFSFPLSLPC